MNKYLKRFSNIQLIAISYIIIILTGTILLTLPCSTNSGNTTSFLDALFTATSATSITGLVVFDTFTHWNLFGQLVIISLIQIGGIGSITLITAIIMITKQKIGLSQRSIMQDSISAPQIGGIINLTKFITIGTITIETIGAILLSFSFIPKFGITKGIYFSIFHSISAFCNAGFDLMGTPNTPFTSLSEYSSNWYINIILMSLIFLGGLGFFVWKDVLNKKTKIKSYNTQTKIVLLISVFLVIIGTILFFILDLNNQNFNNLSTSNKLLNSMFQSVSARTAGFSTIDLSKISESSKLLTIMLMLIGGSTGSTAGGMKTTTIAVLCLSIIKTFKRKNNIEIFGRRIEENIIYTASCIFMLYLLLTLFASITVSAIENVPIITAMFECASAIATVGLSFGLTPTLSIASKIIIIFLMIFGKFGSITMLMFFSSPKKLKSSKLPLDKIQVG